MAVRRCSGRCCPGRRYPGRLPLTWLPLLWPLIGSTSFDSGAHAFRNANDPASNTTASDDRRLPESAPRTTGEGGEGSTDTGAVGIPRMRALALRLVKEWGVAKTGDRVVMCHSGAVEVGNDWGMSVSVAKVK